MHCLCALSSICHPPLQIASRTRCFSRALQSACWLTVAWGERLTLCAQVTYLSQEIAMPTVQDFGESNEMLLGAPSPDPSRPSLTRVCEHVCTTCQFVGHPSDSYLFFSFPGLGRRARASAQPYQPLWLCVKTWRRQMRESEEGCNSSLIGLFMRCKDKDFISLSWALFTLLRTSPSISVCRLNTLSLSVHLLSQSTFLILSFGF